MTKRTIISKYSVILINYFLSSVTYLNNLFASFVNKFFFINKNDIENNFEFIICAISLFGAMAAVF